MALIGTCARVLIAHDVVFERVSVLVTLKFGFISSYIVSQDNKTRCFTLSLRMDTALGWVQQPYELRNEQLDYHQVSYKLERVASLLLASSSPPDPLYSSFLAVTFILVCMLFPTSTLVQTFHLGHLAISSDPLSALQLEIIECCEQDRRATSDAA